MPKKAVVKKKKPVVLPTYDFVQKFSEIPGQKEAHAQCVAVVNQALQRTEDCKKWLEEFTDLILRQIKDQATKKDDAHPLAPKTPRQERRARMRTKKRVAKVAKSTAKSPHRITRNTAELRGNLSRKFQNSQNEDEDESDSGEKEERVRSEESAVVMDLSLDQNIGEGSRTRFGAAGRKKLEEVKPAQPSSPPESASNSEDRPSSSQNVENSHQSDHLRFDHQSHAGNEKEDGEVVENIDQPNEASAECKPEQRTPRQEPNADYKMLLKLTPSYPSKAPVTGENPKSPKSPGSKTPSRLPLPMTHLTPVSVLSPTVASTLKKTPPTISSNPGSAVPSKGLFKRGFKNWSSNGKAAVVGSSSSKSSHRPIGIGRNFDGGIKTKCPPMIAVTSVSSIEAKQKEVFLKKEMLLKHKSETLRQQMKSKLERVRVANETRAAAKKEKEAERDKKDAERKPTNHHPQKQGRVSPAKKPAQSKANESLVKTNDVGIAKRRTLSVTAEQKTVAAEPSIESTGRNNYANELTQSTRNEPEPEPPTLNESAAKQPETQPKLTKVDSYEMTPLRKKKPSTAENYNIDDLNSDDETDDETCPRKIVPKWATGASLKAAITRQFFSDLDPAELFDPTYAPILEQMFRHKRTRFNKRTSSACWDSPLLPPPAKRANI